MLGDIPLELQAYILVLLPAKTLVRTLSLTNHHFHNLVEAHIQRYCLRYLGLGCHSANADGAAVLEFEAQRPIDTVMAKHTLQFSHFAPVTPCIHAQRPPLSSAAVFEFAQGSSSRVSTDAERLRGGRSSGRGRGNSVSIGPERTRMAAGPYTTTPFQPYLPGLAQNDQHRATQAFVSSSLDLEDRVPRRPGLSRNPSSSSSIRSRSRSRSSSTASTSRARAIPQEIANAPYPFLRQNLEAAHRPSLHPNASLGPSTRSHANLATTQQSLEEPLDAYDWAGPPGIPAAPTGLGAGSSARLPRRAADKPACYAFQLEPLDSFESLILTLTARRSIPDVNATIGAILRGEDASGHRLRYSKVLAQGLDRVFREWFKPQASSNSASSSQEPELKTLEFDNTSCTLSIQPHASSRAHVAHPALSSSSQDYLSGPPLSAQYANLASNERVELTFHCEHITINAARLLATLERLEHDVLANQARSGLAMSRLPRIVENVSSMGAGGFPVAAATVNASVRYFIITQPGSAA